jgi:DNA-binding transcriptional regulator YiaG
MPNIATVLKEEIRRLARKETKAQLALIKRASAQQRRDIAALKRQLKDQQRENARLAKAVASGRGAAAVSTPEPATAPRFSPTWLRKHRAKLDISAADYARLVGVSGLTIYNWEKGRSRPRMAQLESLSEVRGLGAREALERIGGKTPRGRRAHSRKA